MKTLIALLFACFAAFASPAQAQTSTVPVVVVVDPAAAYVMTTQRGSVSSWINQELIGRTNTILSNSNTSTQLSLAAIVNNSAVCCTNAPTAWESMIPWVQGSIPIQSARDGSSASMVIVVTNFDPNTQPYSERSGCNSGGGSPRNAIAGFSIAAQSGGRDIAAIAVGTALCTNPYGYVNRRGTGPGDCEAALTVELANTPFNAGVPMTVQTSCWSLTGAGPSCYPNGHAALLAVNPEPTCTYSNGYLSAPTQWTETRSCPSSGTVSYAATMWGQGPYTFACNNIKRLYTFSNPNIYYKGTPTGDSATNNANLIALQAAQAKMYWQARLAPPLKAAATAAIEAGKN